MLNYLSNRSQRVKIINCTSKWQEIIKGVPQGSILGPLIFNIFINDIFYFIDKSTLCNYADDNTLSFSHKNLNTFKETIESESKSLIHWFNINQMQANPDKFQAICVGNKTNIEVKSFTIGQNEIKCEQKVKLLGVELDYQLNFDPQVTNLCKKAAKQLNVLQRLSKFLNVSSRLIIFKSFIRSNFNFCPLIWHFCSKSNTEKLEKLQFRALRIVFNDYESSYDTLLKKVNSTTLHLNRLRLIASETFKCIHNLSPEYLQSLVKVKSSTYNFRYSNILETPQVRTTRYGKNSFRFEAVQVWNSLPEDIRTVDKYKDFVRLIRTWTGSKCKCAMCE